MPATALVDIETTRGPITVVLRRAWAPRGVDCAYNLARAGYFDHSRFYRVIDGFIAPCRFAGDPAIAGVWSQERLPQDARRVSNARGTLSSARYTPRDRATTLFITLRDDPRLDALGFAKVTVRAR